MKIDWKKKLTSRKLWVAIVGFVTPLLIAFGVGESEVTQIASIIMAGATMISYIIGEGLVDASNISITEEVKSEEPCSTSTIGFKSNGNEEKGEQE